PRVPYPQRTEHTRAGSRPLQRSRTHPAKRGGAGSPMCNDLASPSRTSLLGSTRHAYFGKYNSYLCTRLCVSTIRAKLVRNAVLERALEGILRYYSSTKQSTAAEEFFMGLLRIARTPLVTVSPEATVMEAVRTMAQESIGAIAVTEGNRLVGIFSERDLMLRV